MSTVPPYVLVVLTSLLSFSIWAVEDQHRNGSEDDQYRDYKLVRTSIPAEVAQELIEIRKALQQQDCKEGLLQIREELQQQGELIKRQDQLIARLIEENEQKVRMAS